MSACPRCGGRMVDAGMSGTYCNSPGCAGNYWSGNVELEKKNDEALRKMAEDSPAVADMLCHIAEDA